uniref:Uncharacterized protein n=1 Tax=Heterorhabditis bacteriophora TaxID=37862 RepID=A0A1I7X150_HETBA
MYNNSYYDQRQSGKVTKILRCITEKYLSINFRLYIFYIITLFILNFIQDKFWYNIHL